MIEATSNELALNLEIEFVSFNISKGATHNLYLTEKVLSEHYGLFYIMK